MTNYDKWKLASPPENDNECPECEGLGHFEDTSNCCDAPMDSDIMICSKCKEHADFQECGECNGTGEILKD